MFDSLRGNSDRRITNGGRERSKRVRIGTGSTVKKGNAWNRRTTNGQK